MCRAAAEEKLAEAISSIESAEVDMERLGNEANNTRAHLAQLESQSGVCVLQHAPARAASSGTFS
jgi:hypothetical protein